MKKINFNKSQIIVIVISVICMSYIYLRNNAYSSPFEYIWINGEEHCVEHNAEVKTETEWTPADYFNYLSLQGKSFSVSDSLALTNHTPSIAIKSWICDYKNEFHSTCDKSKEGIWAVLPDGTTIKKLN